jgi:hypothetical protein
MITLWISTWSTNIRTLCTSLVTRVMIELVLFASKKRKLSRCSLSYTSPRKSTTSRCCTSRLTDTAYA